MNNIELKAIKDLLGMNFFIPNYQRGYRWNHQQVRDLLDDIKEFMDNNSTNIYCIQPLVVKQAPIREDLLEQIKQASSIDDVRVLVNNSDVWEVIDGQQRLTTIYIILKYLQHEQLYTLKYETRKDSWEYLQNDIALYNSGDNTTNIDFYHMGEAYCEVKEWFATNKNSEQFLQTLLERVKFIWYEVQEDQNSKEIFQRLNLGKISLTNSELIKALFFKHNYESDATDASVMQIAAEWDIIENTLQNDELWAFINTLDYESPTRIDYIFDIVVELDQFRIKADIGNDEYATFRYFYAYFKSGGTTKEAWSSIYKVYDIFNEWYNTSLLYHYIGYIIATTEKKSCEVISQLIRKWLDDSIDKQTFVQNLKEGIKQICKISDKRQLDLSIVYDSEGNPPKSKCRPLLLLHNIETIVRQNTHQGIGCKFGDVFYRFPYNLYKGSRNNVGWDVEHIDSNTENELRNQRDQRDYLKFSYIGTTNEDIKREILEILREDPINNEKFLQMRSRLNSENGENHLEGDEKNQIWNFALLDSKTNRGYGNSPFPAKRRVIIGKEQGLKYEFNDKGDGKITESPVSSTFIPPCTRNAFLKYYTIGQATNLTAWLREDAQAYKDNISKVIGDFLNNSK